MSDDIDLESNTNFLQRVDDDDDREDSLMNANEVASCLDDETSNGSQGVFDPNV